MKNLKNQVPFVNKIEQMVIGKNGGTISKTQWKKVLQKLEDAGYLVGGSSKDMKPTELNYPSEMNSMFRYLSIGTVTYGEWKGAKIVNCCIPVYETDHEFYITADEFIKTF